MSYLSFLFCASLIDASFDVFTQSKSRKPYVLSRHSVGHCKFVLAVILNKRVEAARVHISLQNDFAFAKIFGIDLHDPDMLAVDRCMEKIQGATVKYEISS